MQLFLVLGILTINVWHGHAQNLVSNSSFEDENICSEYTENCAPEAWIATSLWANYYFLEPTKAYDGTHFIGLSAGSLRRRGIRNFLRTRLLCGMRPGRQYEVSFYVFSRSNILDSIGVYFSSGDFMFEKRKFIHLTPQLWSVNGRDSSSQDHREWQKITLTYTATGEEGYIAIGCFKRIDYTGINRADYRDEYYFFLDKITVRPLDKNEKLCPQADSVRRTVYNENPRHDMLAKLVYYRMRNPLPYQPLPTTVVSVVKRVDTLIIPDIFFASASYDLSPLSFHLLDSFARQLQPVAIDSLVIEGHTDSIGSLASNEKLSRNRAISVMEYLGAKVEGLKDLVITRGFAFLRPAASNKTPKGRQQNRRVEIFVYRKE